MTDNKKEQTDNIRNEFEIAVRRTCKECHSDGLQSFQDKIRQQMNRKVNPIKEAEKRDGKNPDKIKVVTWDTGDKIPLKQAHIAQKVRFYLIDTIETEQPGEEIWTTQKPVFFEHKENALAHKI